MIRRIVTISAVVAGWVVSGGAGAQGLVKLADTSTQSGDGSTLYTYDTPAIGGANVAFVARSLNGLVALYAVPTAGGALVKLVDINTKVPHGSGTFTVGRVNYFTAFHPAGCSPPVVGSTAVVFVGLDAAGNEGLYSVPFATGKVKELANYSTPVPGGYEATFNTNYSFCHLAISGTKVVFDVGNDSGVYSVSTNGSDLARVADPNTPSMAPPPFPTVNGYDQPEIAGKTAVYIGGTTGGPFGIYEGSTSSLGTAVVTDGSSEANDFDQFSYPVLGGSSVLFAASASGSEENNVMALIGLHPSVPAKQLFNASTSKVPAGALGDEFGELGTDALNFSGNDGRRQVFSATTMDVSPKPSATYDGVFSSCKSRLSKVVETGDAAFTGQIAAVYGISRLQQATVSGAAVDQFAGMFTLSAPGSPSIYDGSPGEYVVNIAACS